VVGRRRQGSRSAVHLNDPVRSPCRCVGVSPQGMTSERTRSVFQTILLMIDGIARLPRTTRLTPLDGIWTALLQCRVISVQLNCMSAHSITHCAPSEKIASAVPPRKSSRPLESLQKTRSATSRNPRNGAAILADLA